jgi:hypothetical protein
MGGLLAIGAGMTHFGLWGVLFGLAIWIGFYLDQKHGEGQNANKPMDVFWLSLSGTTSLALAALSIWYLTGIWWYVLLGFTKVPLWFGMRMYLPDWKYIKPTGAAATLFGAIVGIGLAFS